MAQQASSLLASAPSRRIKLKRGCQAIAILQTFAFRHAAPQNLQGAAGEAWKEILE